MNAILRKQGAILFGWKEAGGDGVDAERCGTVGWLASAAASGFVTGGRHPGRWRLQRDVNLSPIGARIDVNDGLRATL